MLQLAPGVSTLTLAGGALRASVATVMIERARQMGNVDIMEPIRPEPSM